ncbi:hypothetical protein [Streptomyces sp. NPDC050263]|uniref:hypothetical protein n=1 Tax=Streptomyces sp. NPDC050263 TaxID=3155037 RepID=UPI0034212888
MTAPHGRCFSPLDMARRKPNPPAAPARKPTPAAAPPRTGPRPAAAVPARPQPVDGMVTAADAVRQGKLRQGESFRTMLEQGVRISGMKPNTRLVALTLLGYANFRNGEIHARWRPTPEQLAIATGLTADQIGVQLAALTSRGWIHEFTLASGPRAGERCWQLGVPVAVLQQLRDRAARRASAKKP